MTLYSTGVWDKKETKQKWGAFLSCWPFYIYAFWLFFLCRVSQQVLEGKLYKCINFEIFGVKKIVKFEGRDLLTE